MDNIRFGDISQVVTDALKHGLERGPKKQDVALRHVFLQWARGVSKVEVLVDTLGLPPHSSVVAAGEVCSSLPPLDHRGGCCALGKA